MKSEEWNEIPEHKSLQQQMTEYGSIHIRNVTTIRIEDAVRVAEAYALEQQIELLKSLEASKKDTIYGDIDLALFRLQQRMKKGNQKKLITEIMQDDEKNGLYDAPKKYFAKYLPVGSRINEKGDNVMFKIDNRWTEPTDFDSFLGPDIQEVAGGVLFLCSKDITQEDYLKEGVVHLYFNPQSKDEEKPFKVIGEISPDATWVKEGDEFDEYEQLWKDEEGTLWKSKEAAALNGYTGEYESVCRMKCHCCGTFK
jgi:hypothetical protein